jgi:Flp pilus assembly protein TadG
MTSAPAPRASRRFGADRRGTASIEFAFIAPTLILMYFAVAELSLGIQASRKVGSTTSAVGDLVAQADKVTVADIDTIFQAADAIMQPLDDDPMQIRVSSIRMELNGDIRVRWSRARNTTPYACNSTVSPPDAVLSPGQSIILAEVSYAYQPPIGYLLTGAIDMDEVFYLRPRQSLEVRMLPAQCP